MQLTDQQLFEHCQCGCDRGRHHDDKLCECMRCTEFRSAEANRLQPDLYQRCRCLCPRGEHRGYLHLGRCNACGCRRFLARTAEAEEAELKLLNGTLERVSDTMVRQGGKAA